MFQIIISERDIICSIALRQYIFGILETLYWEAHNVIQPSLSLSLGAKFDYLASGLKPHIKSFNK